jgi:phosphatidylglycerol:prolipoprotein diacylglycerol transferase
MYPRLFTIPAFDLFSWHLGPFSLPTYGVLLATAFLAGLWVVNRQAKRAGLDTARITDLAVWVLLGGLVGAKVLLLAVEWRFYSHNPSELLSIFRSGGVFYGGLLGALLVAVFYVRRFKIPGWAAADVLAPAVILGQAIGRDGCFAAGCCWGKPTTVVWAVTFRDAFAGRTIGTPLDIPLHPTQLYESGAAFIIFFFLLWLAAHRKFEGQVTLAYLFLYSVARGTIEFFRGDASRGTVFGDAMSTSQFIALLMLVAVAVLYPYLSRRARREAPQAAAPSAPANA